MDFSGRRRALRFLGAGALLSAAGFSISAEARASDGMRTPPEGDFRLSRRVERELIDGVLLVVERSWSCRFRPAGRGMLVEGEQLSSLVEAPRELAALAEMERRRVGTGPFPALLSAGGLIASRTAEQPVKAEEVVETALEALARASLDPVEMAQARLALTRLASAAGQSLSSVPEDLFFPDTKPRSFVREVDLAPGLKGEVVLDTSSLAVSGSGLLERTERRLVTRIGDDARTAREIWRLDRN